MSDYNFTELEQIMNNWARDHGLADMVDPEESAVTFIVKGTEMLKVQEDGFYVRGQRIEVGEKEGEEVFSALKEFLVWQRLNRE